MVATANQRPVGDSYPYYIGTTANFFDPGYRAGQIYASLLHQRGMTAASFAAVQGSVTDPLALRIVPKLLAALRSANHGAKLTAPEQQATHLLNGWTGSMYGRLGRGRRVVDVLDRLPGRGVPAVVEPGRRAGAQGPYRAGSLAGTSSAWTRCSSSGR